MDKLDILSVNDNNFDCFIIPKNIWLKDIFVHFKLLDLKKVRLTCKKLNEFICDFWEPIVHFENLIELRQIYPKDYLIGFFRQLQSSYDSELKYDDLLYLKDFQFTSMTINIDEGLSKNNINCLENLPKTLKKLSIRNISCEMIRYIPKNVFSLKIKHLLGKIEDDDKFIFPSSISHLIFGCCCKGIYEMEVFLSKLHPKLVSFVCLPFEEDIHFTYKSICNLPESLTELKLNDNCIIKRKSQIICNCGHNCDGRDQTNITKKKDDSVDDEHDVILKLSKNLKTLHLPLVFEKNDMNNLKYFKSLKEIFTHTILNQDDIPKTVTKLILFNSVLYKPEDMNTIQHYTHVEEIKLLHDSNMYEYLKLNQNISKLPLSLKKLKISEIWVNDSFSFIDFPPNLTDLNINILGVNCKLKNNPIYIDFGTNIQKLKIGFEIVNLSKDNNKYFDFHSSLLNLRIWYNLNTFQKIIKTIPNEDIKTIKIYQQLSDKKYCRFNLHNKKLKKIEFHENKSTNIINLLKCLPEQLECLKLYKYKHGIIHKYLPKNLKKLTLHTSNIKDDELQFLPNTIKYLKLINCKNITNNGLKNLSKNIETLIIQDYKKNLITL